MDAGGAPITGDDAYANPRWEWPEYRDDAVVELRVHGVGGEGPEGMTRDPHPVRVGGDAGVGFWRARNPEVPGSPGHVREVVSWGGTTSGQPRSAFWVILLPFALFNAAGRMTAPGAASWRVDLHQALCRLLALTMTMAVVAMTMGVVIDLVTLQCGALEVCREADLAGRWLLAPLRVEALTDDAAALVGLLSLLPVVAVYLLRSVGRRGVTGTGVAGVDVPLGVAPAQRLDEPDFWHNLWPTWRLRGIHITAGYAWAVVVLATVLPPLLEGLPGWVGRVGLALGVGSLVGNATVAALPRTAATAPSRRLAATILGLRAATLLALGGLLGTSLAEQVQPFPLGWSAGALALAGAGLLVWSVSSYVQHVRDPAAAGAGPSGAARDAMTAVGALSIAVWARLAPGGTTPVNEALELLAREPSLGADWVLAGALPAVYRPLGLLVAVQAVLLVALLVTSVGRADRAVRLGAGPDEDPPFRSDRGPLPTAALPGNTGAPVVALVSLLLVTAVGSGIHGATLDWLGERASDYHVVAQTIAAERTDAADPTGGVPAAALSPRSELELALPWWVPWTAFVVALTVLVLGLTAWGFWSVLRRRAPTPAQLATATGRSLAPLPDDAAPDDPSADPNLWPGNAGVTEALSRIRGQVVRSWQLRVLTERAGVALLVAVTIPTVLVGTGVGVIGALSEVPPDPPLASLWMFALASLPVLAVAAIRTAREDRGLRRQLGRLWDVLAFWPRLTHPFAPPSYGEALVPAVAGRVEALVDRGHPVVLAGHSQGSVVALATALHLPPRDRELHLVTYGSPIRLLYEGLFPAVFGGDDGAIARATPLAPWPPGPAVDDGADDPAPPSTWHNVLALGEPISTPLWRWSVAADVVPGGDGLPGLDGLLTIHWNACSACGWAAPGGSGGPVPGDPPVPAIDVTISDPDRTVSPSGEVDGVVAGHSSYHRSREFDLHLSFLAATIGAD